MEYVISYGEKQRYRSVQEGEFDNEGCAAKCNEIGNTCHGYQLEHYIMFECVLYIGDDPSELNMQVMQNTDTYMRGCSGNTQFFFQFEFPLQKWILGTCFFRFFKLEKMKFMFFDFF